MNRRQRDFNKALFGVRKQGRPSIMGGYCRYTLQDGDQTLHCGVGHVLSKSVLAAVDKYAKLTGAQYLKSRVAYEYERKGISGPLPPKYLAEDSEFYGRLQIAHDTAALSSDVPFIDAFNRKMRAVADTFGLEYTE